MLTFSLASVAVVFRGGAAARLGSVRRLAPPPFADFSCAVESRILLHGRMYVTDTFVCFYSNLFGFEKIIKIPFW